MSAQPAFPYEPVHTHEGIQQPSPIMLVTPSNRIHWSAIWNGFFPALSTMILFGLFGMGVGIVPTTTTTGLGAAEVIWGLVTVIVAFLIGGFVASWTSGVKHTGWGTMNGLMVYLVALPALMLLGALGLGAFFGDVQRATVLGSTAVNGGPAATALGWSFILAAVALIASLLGGWWGTFAVPTNRLTR